MCFPHVAEVSSCYQWVGLVLIEVLVSALNWSPATPATRLIRVADTYEQWCAPPVLGTYPRLQEGSRGPMSLLQRGLNPWFRVVMVEPWSILDDGGTVQTLKFENADFGHLVESSIFSDLGSNPMQWHGSKEIKSGS
mmetsp:Transcript_7359/g.16258  ORF Transcript_7359/g.16258 Transcript_7359/m.16258 type:complete len:137 (-) Transcript_7359:86-496(-)